MSSKPHIIVLGNEKGGTGKSTLSMHVSVALLRMGFSLATLDVDARQGTLSRYLENRKRTAETTPLPLPDHLPILPSQEPQREKALEEDRRNLEEALHKFSSKNFILIDTPGSNTPLSQFAHGVADTLITPLNDSFVDLDVLVRLNSETLDMIKPSTYAEMVWEQKKQRAVRDQGSIDWIVLRNRLSNLRARNKKQMEKVMHLLSKRIGFRGVLGFCERVIFRELFLSGLTVLDLADCKIPLTISHVAARQELRTLIDAIGVIPDAEECVA